MNRTAKVLLITSVFPPNPGIGGRRWAKFAKVLAADGYEVHVLKPKKIVGEISLWNKDVLHSNIRQHSFDLAFQRLTDYTNTNIIKKICSRIFYAFFKLSNHYFTDTSSFSISNIKKRAIQIIDQQQITTVIISANPNYYYVGYLLRKHYKGTVRIVLDYRDLWNDHSYYEIFFKRSKRQIAYSNKIENLALNNCDYLLTVDKHMMSILEKRITNQSVKKMVIPNGFDTTDYKTDTVVKIDPKVVRGINLFFAGSIGEDLTEVMKLFFDAFFKLKEDNNALFRRIKIEIYCNSNNSYLRQLVKKELPENIVIKKNIISMDEYISKLIHTDYGLLFSSKEYSNSFFTKFYDYIYLQKRMINVGYTSGDLSSFIADSNIGLSFFKGDGTSFFSALEKDVELNKDQYLSTTYINQFDILTLKKKVIHVLEELETEINNKAVKSLL